MKNSKVLKSINEENLWIRIFYLKGIRTIFTFVDFLVKKKVKPSSES